MMITGWPRPKESDSGDKRSPHPVKWVKDFHDGAAVIMGVKGWGYLVFTMRGVALLTDDEVKIGRLR